MISEISCGWTPSFETFYSQGDRTRAIEDRNIARDAAEYDDAGRWDATASIVDHEVVRAPQTQCPDREVLLPFYSGQRRGQLAGFLLTEMIAHGDRQGQHPHERSRGAVVGQLGRNVTPVR